MLAPIRLFGQLRRRARGQAHNLLNTTALPAPSSVVLPDPRLPKGSYRDWAPQQEEIRTRKRGHSQTYHEARESVGRYTGLTFKIFGLIATAILVAVLHTLGSYALGQPIWWESFRTSTADLLRAVVSVAMYMGIAGILVYMGMHFPGFHWIIGFLNGTVHFHGLKFLIFEFSPRGIIFTVFYFHILLVLSASDLVIFQGLVGGFIIRLVISAFLAWLTSRAMDNSIRHYRYAWYVFMLGAILTGVIQVGIINVGDLRDPFKLENHTPITGGGAVPNPEYYIPKE